MKNKFKSISIIFLIGILLSACFFMIYKENKDKQVTEVKKEILPVEPFDSEKLLNHAVLFTTENTDTTEVEKLLKEMSEKYNVPVVKMIYNKDVEKFVEEQEKIVSEYYPIVADLGSKLMSPSVNGNLPTFNEDLNNKVLTALSKLENKQDPKEEITYLAQQSKMSEADVKKYLEYRLTLSKVMIERPIYKEHAPVLVMFDNAREFARINALEQDKEQLIWLLINKGFLNLSQNKTLKQVLKAIDKKEEFVVAFGTSTCPYCANTIPLVEKEVKKNKLPYYYVDINTFVNMNEFGNLISKNVLNSDIENTPTIIYFKDGKEINRFVGQQDIFGIQKFIHDTKNMIKNQEEKTKETSDNNKVTTDPQKEQQTTNEATKSNDTAKQPTQPTKSETTKNTTNTSTNTDNKNNNSSK